MTLKTLSYFILILAFTTVSCKPRKENSTLLDMRDRDAPRFNKADIKKRSSETDTEAAMFALRDFGKKLLDYYTPIVSGDLEKMNIKELGKLNQYKITLDGFHEVSWFDHDLSWGQNIDGAAEQVEEVVTFLREFHKNLYGSKFPPFTEVQLRPINNLFTFKDILEQDGFKLKINMYGGDHPNTSDEIRQAWNNCIHLGALCDSKSAKLKWHILNPVGNIVSQFRQTIKRGTEAAITEVGQFIKTLNKISTPENAKFLSEQKEKFIQLIKKFTHDKYETLDKKNLQDIVEKIVSDLESIKDLQNLASKWNETQSSSEFTEEIIAYYAESAFTKGRVRAQRRSVHAWSLIYFEWADDITVRVGKPNDVILSDPAAIQEITPSNIDAESDRILALLTIKLNETEYIDVGNLNLKLGNLFGAQSIAVDRVIKAYK